MGQQPVKQDAEATVGGVGGEPAGRAELGVGGVGGDVAVGPGALGAEEVGVILNGKAALEDGAEAVDDLRREFGEVGEGPVADAPAIAPGHGGAGWLVCWLG